MKKAWLTLATLGMTFVPATAWASVSHAHYSEAHHSRIVSTRIHEDEQKSSEAHKAEKGDKHQNSKTHAALLAQERQLINRAMEQLNKAHATMLREIAQAHGDPQKIAAAIQQYETTSQAILNNLQQELQQLNTNTSGSSGSSSTSSSTGSTASGSTSGDTSSSASSTDTSSSATSSTTSDGTTDSSGTTTATSGDTSSSTSGSNNSDSSSTSTDSSTSTAD
jgi:hypothetical protein